MVKEKTTFAAFKYLVNLKNKQTISHIQYEKLGIQEYLMEGNKNLKVSKFIFKARSRTLDIKLHKKWKYEDKLCVGCKVREESEEEVLTCKFLGEEDEILTKPIDYNWFFGGLIDDMVLVAQEMMKRMNKRKKILDNG